MRNKFLVTSTIAMSALLAACGGDKKETSTPDLPNLVVNAGVDKSSPERNIVTLTGTVTGTENGLAPLWSQVSGPMVSIQNAMSLSAEFRSPSVRDDAPLTFRLSVTDGAGRSTSDELIVTIENSANGPDGPSPQGIPNNGDERRRNARGDRETRMMLDNREVRTYDGSNNNIANPDWGSTFIHLQRLTPSAYGDGISSLAGPSRPSAREVSNKVVNQNAGASIPNTVSGTDFVWQWGQFIDHDLDLTDGAEDAANIAVPAGDVFFDPDNTAIVEIPFSRALTDPNTGFTTDNPLEQENEITSWIDGSMIYGSGEDRAIAVRVGTDSPYLKTSDKNLLPLNVDSLTNANGFIQDPTTLFLAGDIRVNEQLALATMHTLFVREHNRIATILEADFPANTADEVFEATRRLLVAKIQIITFQEWLPALIGNAVPDYAGYDPSINPSIYNGFSAAAFRLGHSMLNEQILRLDADGNEIAGGNIQLAQAFFTAPQILIEEDSLDPILRGLATQTHQKLDQKVVSDLRNFLFGAPGDGGLDLPSLNIQRGRDHGLPDYNTMRVAMGLNAVTGFSDISSDATIVADLSSTYSTVDDIDLWVGGLSENPVAGSQLGPLFQAIITRQFTEVRDGDRFWYRNDLNPQEMDRVRGTSLSRIIRDNTNIGSELQANVFQTP